MRHVCVHDHDRSCLEDVPDEFTCGSPFGIEKLEKDHASAEVDDETFVLGRMIMVAQSSGRCQNPQSGDCEVGTIAFKYGPAAITVNFD